MNIGAETETLEYKNPSTAAGLNESQIKLLNLLKDHPAYTIKDLVRESALSDAYVRKILTELKTKSVFNELARKKLVIGKSILQRFERGSVINCERIMR